MNWAQNALPTLDSREDDVLAYRQRHINPISPRRRWITQRAALNSWFYHGRQWIEPVGELTAGQGVYHFREVYKQSLAAYKRPVTNLIAPAVDNEVARLTKKDYMPEAAASRSMPDWIAAAALAKDIVSWRMQQNAWVEQRGQLAFNLIIDETAIARTCWEETISELVPVASLDAVVCKKCKQKLASNILPATMIDTGIPVPGGGFVPFMNAESVEEMPFEQGRVHTVRAKACPLCQGGELESYTPEPEEVEDSLRPGSDQVDALGNPMGRKLPAGKSALEVVSLHDFYPENGGIGIEPFRARVWHQRTPMPLETIVVRWPQFEKTLQPDDPQAILRLNPLYSDPALVTQGLLFGLAAHGMDAYANHALVDEIVIERSNRPGLEHGAHFVIVNDKVLSRPLCVEIDAETGKEYVPRIRYHVARAKRVPGMFWGRGPVSDCIPLNRRLNEIDAQMVDLRERGKTMMWVPQNTELYFRKDTEGSLQIMEYEASPNWSPRDGYAPNVPMTGNVYMTERAQIISDFQFIWGPQDIELGRGAGGIKTTSGMMLAQEQSGTQREPRERSLVGLYEGIFQHTMDLERTFQHEKQTYQVTSDSGIHEIKSWERTQLVGTIKVKMKAAAGFDQALYDKEATAEAIQMGLYQLNSPVDVMQALKNMRLPQTVNEGFQVQIRRAEMAWSDFMNEDTVPLLDEQLYDPTVWYPIFQKRWLGDDCLTRQQAVGFEKFWARLAGWEDVLKQMEAQDAVLRRIYGSLPPEQWQAAYAQATGLYETAVGQLRASGVIPAVGPPPPGSGLEQPPPEPPDPEQGFLPKKREIRIYTVWERMLGPFLQDALLAADVSSTIGVEVNEDAAMVRELMVLLKMRAVIEALRFMLQALLAPPPAPVTPGAPGAEQPPEPGGEPPAGGGGA